MNTNTIKVINLSDIASGTEDESDLITEICTSLIPTGANDGVIYSADDFIELSKDILDEFPELEESYKKMVQNIYSIRRTQSNTYICVNES